MLNENTSESLTHQLYEVGEYRLERKNALNGGLPARCRIRNRGDVTLSRAPELRA